MTIEKFAALVNKAAQEHPGLIVTTSDGYPLNKIITIKPTPGNFDPGTGIFVEEDLAQDLPINAIAIS